jgi:hypothetical protein
MPPVRFEPKISAGERPQTYALVRSATGTEMKAYWKGQICPAAYCLNGVRCGGIMRELNC